MSLGDSIGSSLGRAIGAALSGGGWSPLSLFQSGEQGLVYDAMDLSSFYSDDALTTPCAVNTTCGSWRDVRGLYKAYQSTAANRPILRGTPTGANLVTNGDFATAANWTPGAGWAIGSGVATATASSAALTHTIAATSGRVYRVRYTMTRSAGTLTPSFGGVTLTARSASDTYEEWITASSTAALVFTAAAFTGTLDDVAIHDCSADVVSAPYGLQMGTIAGVDRWMQTAAAFAHDSDWSVCVGIKSYAFADGVYPYGVATVRGGTSDTEGFILAVASGASVRTRAYSTETGFTNTLSAATPYVLLASKQQAAHVRTAWVSGQIEESDASAFATTPAATSNQSARFGLNYDGIQFMPMIWYGGVLIGRELNASEKAQLRQWVSARTPGTTL